MDLGLIDIPPQLPLLSLSNAVLFPQGVIPVYFFGFEQLRMLKDVLRQDRLLIISHPKAVNTPCVLNHCSRCSGVDSIGTIGIIRACYNSTSKCAFAIIQGVKKVKINNIYKHYPYKNVNIQSLNSKYSGDTLTHSFARLKEELLSLVYDYISRSDAFNKNLIVAMTAPINFDLFLDIITFSVCKNILFQYKIIQTIDLDMRAKMIIQYLGLLNKGLISC